MVRVSHRAAAYLAWSLWALCVTLAALAVALDLYTLPVPARHGPNFEVIAGVPLLVYPTVGAFLALHRPKNAVGWILCGIGLMIEVHAFAGAYADYALFAHPGTLPGGIIMLWLTEWLVAPTATLGAVLLVLLFPTGRPPSRAWWTVAWIAVGGAGLFALWWATQSPNFYLYRSLDNPFWMGGPVGNALDALGRLGATTLLIMCVASVIGVFIRLGGAHGEERQQIKWFAYAASMLLTTILLIAPAAQEIGGPAAAFVFMMIGLMGVPVAVGVAILRYHLYDIDRIINRTLVYGSLTGMLALVYFGGVTATQAVFTVLTGQQEQLPQLVVVGSTLLIAALFNPLRHRIQSFIDRRFYRRNYDARKTLKAFSLKLKNETDLQALNNDLLGVVRETMQPAHVSLWLRSDPAHKGGSRHTSM
jgi:hypothetical protein